MSDEKTLPAPSEDCSRRPGRCEEPDCGRDFAFMSDVCAIRDGDFGAPRIVCKSCCDKHRAKKREARLGRE